MKRHHCTDCEGLDAEDDEDWSVNWFCHAECEVFGRFAGNEECTEKPDEPFQWERMQCVFEGSSLKSAGVDGDIINAHDKNHTAGCDKGKNEFLKFCFWHSKPSHNNLCFSLVNSLFLTFSFFHRDCF